MVEGDGDRSVLAIRAGRSRFTLQTLPESDFPDITAGEMAHRFVLPAGELKRLIDKTQFAISTEETRYYLNGIFLHVSDEGEGLLRAMVALQDLDRLTQTAVALAEFARKVAGADGVTDPPHMTQIVAEMPLRSVADRLGASLGLTPELLVGVH